MSGQDKNRDREKEEKLFRALSGVDEELLLRSEQSNDTKKQKENGKIHRFPLRYASRIAAACLCFVVAGVLYMTMNGTKIADSTGADMAAQAVDTAAGNECAAPSQVYETAQEAKSGDTAEEAEMAEDTDTVAEITTEVNGFVTENVQQAAQNSDSMDEKQGSQMSADTDSVVSVSGNEASGAEDGTEASEEQTEGTLTEKQVRPSLRKMTTKGQQENEYDRET